MLTIDAIDAPGRIAASLQEKPYFCLVDGFTGDEDSIRRQLLRLCASLGDLRVQNLAGGTLSEVRADGGGPARGARTTNALLWHTDSIFVGPTPDTVALCVVRSAAEGGISRLIAADAIVAELKRRHPQHVARLTEPFLFNRTDYVREEETQFVSAAVLDLNSPDGPTVLYNRVRIHRGHQLAGTPLTDDDRLALDALDDVLESPRTPRVDLLLSAGSTLFFNNRRLLHNRTAYREDPASRRLLYRVWIGT